MIRRPPKSTQGRSSTASDVYKRQHRGGGREPDHERDRHRDDGDGDRKRRVQRDRNGAKAPRKHHDDERAAAATAAPAVAAPRDRDDDRRASDRRGYGDHRPYRMTIDPGAFERTR